MSILVNGVGGAFDESVGDETCFYCSGKIGERHGVSWSGNDDIYLHVECALEFANRLLMDVARVQLRSERRKDGFSLHGFFQRHPTHPDYETELKGL